LTERGIKVGILAARFFDLPSNDWLHGESQKITHSVEGPLNVVRAAQRLRQPGPFHRIPFVYNASIRQRQKLALRMFDAYVDKHGLPDIIHGHCALWGGVLASAIVKKCDLPFLLTEHASVIPRKIAGPRERKTAERTYHTASINCSISPSLIVDLNTLLDLDNIEFEVTPHMVDEKFVYTPPSSSDETFNWLSVSNLVEDKGHDTLLRAFAKLNDKKSMLTIVGDGPLMGSLQLLSKSLDINDRVVFTGIISRDEIPNTFTNSHAFIHPSRYETQGIVIIEALATGRPVISTKCGGPNHVIKEGDGYLIPIDDEQAIVDSMKNMMNNKWDGESISERCIQRFGKSVIIDQLEELYSTSINQN